MDKNIYTQADFMNLTKDEITDIVRLLDIEIPSIYDIETYLFNNINMLESNDEVKNIITNKVLAGQTSVKWYKFEYNENFYKEILKDKLNDPEIGYNQKLIDRANIYDSINCIVNQNNEYTLKILLQDGFFNIPDGINVNRSVKVRSIVVKIDIDNCWVEIRSPENKAGKVKSILYKDLGFPKLEEVNILSKYSIDINKFKEDLYHGFYMNYKAMPIEIVDLSDNDKTVMAKIIQSIDEYFQDKDKQKLVDTLETIDYDTESLSLVSILLAGLENVGMGIKPDSTNDISEQSFYVILKDHIIENTSYIRFSNKPEGELYTMKVGLKSNSIRFMSSVTEDVIQYIRNKIL